MQDRPEKKHVLVILFSVQCCLVSCANKMVTIPKVKLFDVNEKRESFGFLESFDELAGPSLHGSWRSVMEMSAGQIQL